MHVRMTPALDDLLDTHPRGGPLGKGPGVSSGRSSEPAGGTGQTEKGGAEGRLQGGDHRQRNAQQRERVYHSTESGVLWDARRRNQRRANRGDSSIFSWDLGTTKRQWATDEKPDLKTNLQHRFTPSQKGGGVNE